VHVAASAYEAWVMITDPVQATASVRVRPATRRKRKERGLLVRDRGAPPEEGIGPLARPCGAPQEVGTAVEQPLDLMDGSSLDFCREIEWQST